MQNPTTQEQNTGRQLARKSYGIKLPSRQFFKRLHDDSQNPSKCFHQIPDVAEENED